MPPTINTRPQAINLDYYPGQEITLTFTFPAGYLSSVTLKSFLGGRTAPGVELDCAENTDVLTVFASAADTAAFDFAAEWVLQPFTAPSTYSDPIFVGTWTPGTEGQVAPVTASYVVRTPDEIAVAVTAQLGTAVIADGDKGDITVSASGSVWTIGAGVVTPTKLSFDPATQAELDAEAALARNGDNITSGTVADARIASTIARDSEVAAGYQPLDADLTALAAAGNSTVLAATTASFLTADETKLDGIEAGADVTDAANVAAAGAVMESDYDANTILIATSDNTPIPLTIAEQRIVGRITGGAIDDLTGAVVAAILAGEVFKQAQEVNAQTGTTYTLVAGDAGKLVTLSNAGAITLTVPQDTDATIAIGTYVDLYQLGAGQVTVAAGSGATLRVSGLTAKARAQYSRLGVQKVSANTWSLFGDLAAS